VNTRPEFRRYEPREIRNPFTGGTMAVQPAPDAAEVVLNGRTVGEMAGPVVVGIPVDYRNNHRLMEIVHPSALN
jgi:hypothetical protein